MEGIYIYIYIKKGLIIKKRISFSEARNLMEAPVVKNPIKYFHK